MRLIDVDALLNDPSNISANEFGDDVVFVEDINKAPTVELPHGKCKTCKHFIRGGLDGKTYVCEHPAIEQDDYYNYAFLMVEENDYCSSYEKKEGEDE